MTDDSISPSLLRTYVEPAPSPSDPAGSRNFYAAPGIAIVAWGRLEGHFTLLIVTILNIASHKRIGKKLPMKWERLVEVWRTAFETVPALAALRPMADRFIVQLDELAQHRNRLVHGYWELFDPGPPIRIDLTSVKAAKGDGGRNAVHSRFHNRQLASAICDRSQSTQLGAARARSANRDLARNAADTAS